MNEVNQSYCLPNSLVVRVFNEANARLDRQAVIKLHEPKRDLTTWQTTTSDSETTFCNIDFGDYEVEASAVGYMTERKELHVSGTIPTVRLEIVLRRDPAAVELSALDDAIPAGARKDAKHAVYALKSQDLKEAQKRLDKLYRVAPSSAQVNFLYGYLLLELQDLEKSEAYLSRAASLDPRRIQTLTLLGRVQLERQHYDEASRTLEQALQADPGSWMAHNLLGDAYLRQKQYEKAREQAQLAIDQGKDAASVAQLVLGQALANVGRDQEGVEALKTFVATNPNNPATAQVKTLIAEIEKRDADAGNGRMDRGADLSLAASPASLSANAWAPPGVDEVKPSVAKAVSCPTQQILAASGERIKQFVDDMGRFAAIEEVVHEQLDAVGNPLTKETRKFNYVVTITEPSPGLLATDEYRIERYGIADLPDHIVTRGFVSLALIFHPDMQQNYQMDCEGLGEWRGQATWLIHFRQREDKPSTLAEYVAGAKRYALKLKGRAWIAANNFQIVRMESDLASSVPQLSVQHQMVEYGPVLFHGKQVELWLPQNVDIYLELNRHRYYRRHSFDHYMLFSVNSEDKAQVPKDASSNPVQNR